MNFIQGVCISIYFLFTMSYIFYQAKFMFKVEPKSIYIFFLILHNEAKI